MFTADNTIVKSLVFQIINKVPQSINNYILKEKKECMLLKKKKIVREINYFDFFVLFSPFVFNSLYQLF